jgi:hypothetical protein
LRGCLGERIVLTGRICRCSGTERMLLPATDS